jgi:anti-sigma-K factor RskA
VVVVAVLITSKLVALAVVAVVAGAINKITEIITGPKPLLVVVKLNGDQLELTWPDGLKSRHTRQPK